MSVAKRPWMRCRAGSLPHISVKPLADRGWLLTATVWQRAGGMDDLRRDRAGRRERVTQSSHEQRLSSKRRWNGVCGEPSEASGRQKRMMTWHDGGVWASRGRGSLIDFPNDLKLLCDRVGPWSWYRERGWIPG